MTFVGRVAGLGKNKKYSDGVEPLEIHIDKRESRGLPTEDGKRVAISLVLAGRKYEAGLRSTVANDYVWICPDLKDDCGKDLTLAHVLCENGFEKNQKVELEVSGETVAVRSLG